MSQSIHMPKPVLLVYYLVAFVVFFGTSCRRNDIADGKDTASESERNGYQGVPAEIQILLDEASKAKADGSLGFAGYYIGMSEEKAARLTSYYIDMALRRGLSAEGKPYVCTPNSRLVSRLHFNLSALKPDVLGSVYGISPASFDGVKRSLGTVSSSTSKEVKGNFRMHDHMVYEFKSEKGHSAKITKGDNRDSIIFYGMDLQIEGPIVLHSGRDEALSIIRMASTNALSELASNMVQLPGKDYFVCKYKVTKALWFSIMGNPGQYWYLDEYTHPNQSANVTYPEAVDFIAKLNQSPVGHNSGFVYRLPTFEEWEFACRAGAKDGYCQLKTGEIISDDTIDKVGEVYMVEPVGNKLPNA